MGSRVPISNAVLRRRRRFFPAHSLIKWHPISVWKRRLVIGTYCYVIGIFRNSCRVAFFCLFFFCAPLEIWPSKGFFSHWFFFSNKFFKKYLFPPADEFLKMRKGKGACRCVCFFLFFFFSYFFFGTLDERRWRYLLKFSIGTTSTTSTRGPRYVNDMRQLLLWLVSEVRRNFRGPPTRGPPFQRKRRKFF